jgi:Domain of unknown function (DUF5667)
VRTPRPKPNRLHDELDALLDGRPVELTDELAPLAEAADALRGELAAYELDPAVADRHLERVLEGSGSVLQLPVRRPQPIGWELRRRVAAVVLAAALVLAPATMASAAALPGQAIYPLKLAIEELRIASVQWSPGREASERTRVADERLHELNRLVKLRMFSQVPPTIHALNRAVIAATVAVEKAGDGPAIAALKNRLEAVKVARMSELTTLVQKLPLNVPDRTRRDIEAAVSSTPPLVVPGTAVTTPTSPTAATQTSGTQASGPASSASQTSVTQPEPPTTTTVAPTTTTEPPTTVAPTTTGPPTTDTVSEGGGSGDGDQAGEDERSPDEAAPTTTVLPGP